MCIGVVYHAVVFGGQILNFVDFALKRYRFSVSYWGANKESTQRPAPTALRASMRSRTPQICGKLPNKKMCLAHPRLPTSVLWGDYQLA